MKLQFTKATKEQAKARIALIGPSGSGKTYTALRLAEGLGQRIAVIDTENASASKYAGEFNFDVLALELYAPNIYVQAIQAAEGAGYDVLIIDSLSHAWAGKGGALEMVDKAAKKYSGNSFAAWRDVTPHHNALVDAMVRCGCHLIVTMRSKTEYVVQAGKDGKMTPKKIGMAPVQRDGVEYEFDIVADLDLEHNLIVSKTRCRTLDGAILEKPGADMAQTIRDWLTDGAEPTPQRPQVVTKWWGQMIEKIHAQTDFYSQNGNGPDEDAILDGLMAAGWIGTITDDNVKEALELALDHAYEAMQADEVSE